MRCLLSVFVSALALLLAGLAGAHGSVSARVERLTQELAEHPNDANRYAARGRLNALEENWTQAATDLEEARELLLDAGEPWQEVAGVELQLAAVWLELGRPGDVIALLDGLCGRPAPPPDAFLLRGRAHVARGELALGVADLSANLHASTTPNPDAYRERARAIAARGSAHVTAAVESLEEGMRALGPLATLLELAIELETERGAFDAALRLVDRLSPALRATPRWLARRAQLLADGGHTAEADQAFGAALHAIEASSARRRATNDLSELRQKVMLARGALAPTREDEPPVGKRPVGERPPPTHTLWAVVGAMLLCAYLGARWQRSRPRPR